MEKEKFEPRNWRFEPVADNMGETENVLGAIRGDLSELDTNYHIARVWSDAPFADKSAAILGAALRMYTALKAAIPAIEFAHQSACLSTDQPSENWQWHKELKDARAALAQADGK